ncbi:hypothetical protein [Streptomyces sp. NPDC002990]
MDAPSPHALRPRVRPHGAWYAAPAALLLAALTLAGFGVAAGLLLTAGKHFVCDATTECAQTPYEPGYQAPAWPHMPFVAAAVCAGVAAITFTAVLVARRRSR